MDPLAIVVCVKQVPDSWAEKTLRPGDHRLDRDAADAVLNELDELAVEEALRIRESHAGEATVTALSMGPERATEALRRALSLGVDAAVLVSDPGLVGSDALATSAVLAQALGRLGFDLVVMGSESTDARMAVLPAMLAERLGVAQLTFARRVELGGTEVTVERMTGDGVATVRAALPAVVSVVEKINEPRYPSFTGIMAAKRKPLTTWTLADLETDGAVLTTEAATEVMAAAPTPARAAGEVFVDDGTGGRRLADYLRAHKFAAADR